eukprot:6213464-Pleurochrysis_carterae.AAC.4
MVVSTIANKDFLAQPGWSLQVDPVKYLVVRYTPNEGVRSPDRAALMARSDDASRVGSRSDRKQYCRWTHSLPTALLLATSQCAMPMQWC